MCLHVCTSGGNARDLSLYDNLSFASEERREIVVDAIRRVTAGREKRDVTRVSNSASRERKIRLRKAEDGILHGENTTKICFLVIQKA